MDHAKGHNHDVHRRDPGYRDTPVYRLYGFPRDHESDITAAITDVHGVRHDRQPPDYGKK